MVACTSCATLPKWFTFEFKQETNTTTLLLNPAKKDTPFRAQINVTLNDGVYTTMYSFFLFVIKPPENSLKDFNQIQPSFVKQPDPIKMKQGDSFDYYLP